MHALAPPVTVNHVRCAPVATRPWRMQVVSVNRMASLCTPGGGARDSTPGAPVRHRSGSADHQDPLAAEGIELTYPAGRLLGIWTR